MRAKHPFHKVRSGEGNAAAGQECGCPLTRCNDISSVCMTPGVAVCAGCGDIVQVDAATQERIDVADRLMEARLIREEKGHLMPGPKPGRKSKPARNMPLFK
jgi:hypothetical protein